MTVLKVYNSSRIKNGGELASPEEVLSMKESWSTRHGRNKVMRSRGLAKVGTPSSFRRTSLDLLDWAATDIVWFWCRVDKDDFGRKGGRLGCGLAGRREHGEVFVCLCWIETCILFGKNVFLCKETRRRFPCGKPSQKLYAYPLVEKFILKFERTRIQRSVK